MNIPTVAEIRDQILADIQSETGAPAPLLPRSVWRVLATALAGALALLYRFAAWAYDQIFTESADEAALIARGREYGLARTPAQEWRGTATATGTNGTAIPQGTRYQKDGAVYETTEAATIDGATTISLRSLASGDAVSLSVSDTIELASPIAGVDRDATVATVTQAGEDAESLEDFRARLLQRQRNQPQGGAIPDYVLWATEVAGIAEAFAFQPSPGFVNVYPLTDDPDPVNRVPGSSKLTEVENYLNDEERKPLNAQVSTVAFTELTFNVDIADLSPNTATVKSDIESAIEDHLYSRRPEQYSDEPDPKNVISAARLTAIAIAAGAEVASVTLKNAGGSAITSYTLADSELAVLGSVTWV